MIGYRNVEGRDPLNIFDSFKQLNFSFPSRPQLFNIIKLEGFHFKLSNQRWKQQKNNEQIYMVAHKLKGESANFGRPRIEEIAHHISQMGRSNQLANIEQHFTLLEQEVNLFIADLKLRVLNTTH